jgi:hypothetical protein
MKYIITLFISILIIPFYFTIFIPFYLTTVLIPFILLIFWGKITLKSFFAATHNYSIWLFLFFISAIMSSFFAENMELSIKQLSNFLICFVFFKTILVLAENISNNSLDIIYKSLLIGLMISCFIGIMQFTGNKLFFIQSEESLNQNTNIDSTSWGIRVWGTFGNALTFSNYLSVVAILICTKKIFSPKNSFFSFFLFFFTLIVLFLSGGRTASISFALIYFIALLKFSPIKNKGFIIISIASLLISTFFLSSIVPSFEIFSRFIDSKDDFQYGRWYKWLSGMDVFYNNFLLGVGPGNLNLTLRKYPVNEITSESVYFIGGHVESVYISILATFGITGFGVLSVLIYKMLKSIIKNRREIKRGIYFEYYTSLIFGWIVMFINMITNPALLVDDRIKFLFFILIALTIILDKKTNIS